MTPSGDSPATTRFERLLALLRRHPALLPMFSLAFGVASFLLVQRGEQMARLMAVIALLGWPWLLLEDLIGDWLSRRSQGRLPPATARFLTQQVQQELLFFSLPFLFTAMQWVPGQIGFMALAALLALAATLDPLYWHRIAPNLSLSLAFHAACNLVAILVILPIAVQLPAEQALPIAFASTALIVLASLPRLYAATRQADGKLDHRRALATPLLVGSFLLMAWFARAAIPPAGLWVRDARITDTLDGHQPGVSITRIERDRLTASDASLVAFVAVRAPRGLSQSVVFEWFHDGQPVDRIAAQIDGGREGGFRTWSRKQNFGESPEGRWRVDLRTSQGQLIARRRFEVD